MDFNWTLEVFWNLFETITISLGIGVLLRTIKRGNSYQHITLMFLAMFLYFLRYVFLTLSLMFLSVHLFALSYMVISIQFVLLIMAADSLYRDTIDPKQLSFFLVLATTAIVATILTPNAVVITTLPNGTRTILANPYMSMIALPSFLLGCIIYLGLLVKVHLQAPPSLKNYSRLMIIGFLLFSFVPTALDLAGLQMMMPGSIQIIAGIGILIWAYPLALYPKLVFVLSFKILRLTVIDTDSGIPLFTHTWRAGQDIINDDLFSGMMHGVSLIIKESLNRGNVREIVLENGLMIVQRSPRANIACVLVATKPSQTLRDALQLFTQKFYNQFKDLFESVNNTSQFEMASALVAECFSFVPEYE